MYFTIGNFSYTKFKFSTFSFPELIFLPSMATTKRLLSLLLLALAAPRLHGRHMSSLMPSSEIDNSIAASSTSDTSTDAGDDPADWVRISLSPPPSIHHTRGAHLELECEAVGSPAPILRWVKDGKPLAELDAYDTNLVDETTSHGLAKVRARLLVHALVDGNAGVYTCVAQAGTQVATAQTQLHVKSSGGLQGMNLSQVSFMTKRIPARIVLYDTIYMDHIGEDIILPCSSVGSPLPEVFWLDPDENPLTEDKRYSTLPNGALLIRNIRWNDMGPYTCIARNNHGQDNITTFLYPMLAERK